MASYTKEPWMDPAKNTIAANKRMEGTNVKAVILVGKDGEPMGSGGSLDVSAGNSGLTSTVSTVGAATSTTTIAAANSSRVSVKIYNNSTANLFVREASGGNSANFSYKLLPGDTLIVDDYKGILTGAWSAVNGGAQVTITIP